MYNNKYKIRIEISDKPNMIICDIYISINPLQRLEKRRHSFKEKMNNLKIKSSILVFCSFERESSILHILLTDS